jgi:flagellar operon protein
VHRVDAVSLGLPARETERRERARGKAGEFAGVLEEKLGTLRFSQHALSRLESRQVNLTPQDLQQLDRAVSLAAAKGAKESLVLIDDLALVVSITNRTVITALKEAEGTERVYTGIDSAVIMRRGGPLSGSPGAGGPTEAAHNLRGGDLL